MTNGIPKTQFHPTSRRQVIASADAMLKQVQVVDKDGRVRAIVVWVCGPDMYWSETMDGLFDNARRKKAPDWLVQQLKDLPLDRQFNPDGSDKSSPGRVEAPATRTANHVPSDTDTDLPQFAQA